MYMAWFQSVGFVSSLIFVKINIKFLKQKSDYY